jgi:hypothetical protein
MMGIVLPFGGLIRTILDVIWLVAVVAGVFSFIHALRQRADAFTAVDKLTKRTWLIILAVAIVVLLLASSVLGLLGIAGIVAICVYLVDVRPRVNEIQRPRW